MCLHTGTFCVSVCIVLVLSIKYSMYNKTFMASTHFVAVASLTCPRPQKMFTIWQ